MPATKTVVTASALSLLCACATAGTGRGTLEQRGKPEGPGPSQGEEVWFSWRAGGDTTRGAIEAALPDGRVFSGRYIQISEDVVPADPGAYWTDLGAPGVRWGESYGYQPPTTVRERTGRVIAHLDGPDGQMMQCEFDLSVPLEGLRSGGPGRCDLSTGETIENATLRHGR